MQNTYQQLMDVLTHDERLVVDGKLAKNKVIELALQLDVELLKLLRSSKDLSAIFFQVVGDILVFDKIKFQSYISNKQFLPDSFTAYKNKIGLTIDKKYLIDNDEVVLTFPYKDCVLEGGQTQEDARRDEVFWNEVLAKDEIDKLLEPKALTGFRKYDKGQETEISELSYEDNLIIKGNNLLSLHSLKKKYKGKIKLIYIDPPYNTRTSANTFVYNNTFNHSSWLTFMKNRLEVARDLLSDDGIIFIDIDHYELFYLGVLADEIFGYENRIGVLAVVHNLKGRYNEFFANSHENKIVYAKNALSAKIQDLREKDIANYPHKDGTGNYKTIGLQRTGDGSKREERPNLFYPIFYNSLTGDISLEDKKDYVKILPIDDAGIERRWRWSKDKVGRDWKTEIEVKKSGSGYKIYTKLRFETNGEKAKTIWFKPEYSGTTGTKDLKDLVGEKLFTYPKSVQLVKDSIKIAAEEDDIVLDFFGGSGTTAQAVLELNKEDGGSRKFIICEQMDYVENVTKERIRKVMEKQSSGTFVYAELAKANQIFVDKIQDAKATKDLLHLWREMKETAFLSYKLKPENLDANRNEFEKLSLEEQQKILISILDKNLLYVPFSEIDDKTYSISAKDKELNRKFYSDK
jgi:adenine-specific DNA-methyltransferase